MPKALVDKEARGRLALRGGVTAEEIFNDLSDTYRVAIGAEKTSLALELLPYLMPKLKQVDMTMIADVEVTVRIGGIDLNGEN